MRRQGIYAPPSLVLLSVSPSSVDFKNEWSLISIALYSFMTYAGISLSAFCHAAVLFLKYPTLKPFQVELASVILLTLLVARGWEQLGSTGT